MACGQRGARLHRQRCRNRAGQSGGCLVLPGHVGCRRHRNGEREYRQPRGVRPGGQLRNGRSHRRQQDRPQGAVHHGDDTSQWRRLSTERKRRRRLCVCRRRLGNVVLRRHRRQRRADRYFLDRNQDVRRHRRGRRGQFVDGDRDLHGQADADGRRACEGLDRAEEQRRCRAASRPASPGARQRRRRRDR